MGKTILACVLPYLLADMQWKTIKAQALKALALFFSVFCFMYGTTQGQEQLNWRGTQFDFKVSERIENLFHQFYEMKKTPSEAIESAWANAVEGFLSQSCDTPHESTDSHEKPRMSPPLPPETPVYGKKNEEINKEVNEKLFHWLTHDKDGNENAFGKFTHEMKDTEGLLKKNQYKWFGVSDSNKTNDLTPEDSVKSTKQRKE